MDVPPRTDRAEPSALGPDELIEPCHAGLSIDRNLPVARSRPMDSQTIEGLTEDPLDVLRAVREVVPDAPHTSVVRDDSAAVAVYQPAQQSFGLTRHELPLPTGEVDPPVMLSAGPMLGNQARPVL